jgi:hypothetical protein
MLSQDQPRKARILKPLVFQGRKPQYQRSLPPWEAAFYESAKFMPNIITKGLSLE